MNKDVIQGNWEEIKGKIQKNWGKITNDQITEMKGSYKELEGMLQKAYGYEKDQADQEIKSFINKNKWK